MTNHKPNLALSIILWTIPLSITISTLIIYLRITYLRNVLNSALIAKDYSKLSKYSTSKLISILGHSLSFLQPNPQFWDVLQWAHDQHSKSFAFVLFYSRILLKSEKASEIPTLLSELNDLSSGSIVEQIILIFYDMYSFRFENKDNSKQISLLASHLTDEFLRSLSSFWTEILIGRKARLMSLTYSVNSQFLSLISFFSLAGTDGANAQCFQRINSIFVLDMIKALTEKENKLLRGIGHQKFGSSFKFLEKHKLPYNLPISSPEINAYTSKFSKRIHFSRQFYYSIPFLFAFCLLIIYIIFPFCYIPKYINLWNSIITYQKTIHEYGLAIILYPWLSLNDQEVFTDEMKKSGFPSIFSSDPYHFPSQMINASSDLQSILNNIVINFPLNISKADALFPYPNSFEELFSKQIITYVKTPMGIRPSPAGLITYVPIMIDHYLDSLLGRSELTYLSILLPQFIDSLSQYFQSSETIILAFFEYPETLIKNCIQKFDSIESRLIIYLCSTSAFLLVSAFILEIYFLNSVSKNYELLFAPLFVLPKVAISKLLDKISDHFPQSMANAELTSQQKYNVKQLSYIGSPQTYTTHRKLKISSFIYNSVFLIIFLLFLIPVSLPTTKHCNNISSILQSLSSTLNGIGHFFILTRNLFEVLLRFINKDYMIPERSRLVIQKIWNNSLVIKHVFQDADFIGHYINSQFNLSDANLSIDVEAIPILSSNSIERYSYISIAVFDFINTASQCQSLIEDSSMDLDEVFKKTTSLILSKNSMNLVYSLLTVIIIDFPNNILQIKEESFNTLDDSINLYIAILILFVLIIAICGGFQIYSFNFLPLSSSFAYPSFSTTPIEAVDSFSQFIQSDTAGKQDLAVVDNMKQNAQNFEHLLRNVIFLDADGQIIYISSSTSFLLEGDIKTGIPINKFLEDKVERNFNITFPLEKTISFEIVLNVHDNFTNEILVNVSIIPVPKYEFISYVCLIEDVTHLNNLIHQLNTEANCVRELAILLAPKQVLSQIVEETEKTTIMLPKAVLAAFIISFGHVTSNLKIDNDDNSDNSEPSPHQNYNKSQLSTSRSVSKSSPKVDSPNEEDFFSKDLYSDDGVYTTKEFRADISGVSQMELFSTIQRQIRLGLSEHPQLTFIGRSCQYFQIIADLDETAKSVTEQATDVVNFAMDLLSRLKSVETSFNLNLEIRIGIQTASPLYAKLVSTEPLLYELFGPGLETCIQAAVSGTANHIRITRDVYEALFDQGFRVTFDNEITTVDGTTISIHTIDKI